MQLRTSLLAGVAAAALIATPAFATDYSTEKQKDQLIYQQQTQNQPGGQTESGAANAPGAIGETKPNSGPGVKGPPDTRTGPATRAPQGSDASTGTSSGESGMQQEADKPATTQPSQDSSGVQGFPDTRTGPSTKQPHQ